MKTEKKFARPKVRSGSRKPPSKSAKKIAPMLRKGNEKAAMAAPPVGAHGEGKVGPVRVKDITVPKHRARRLHDVTALAESIAQAGLIEPIVVRRVSDGSLVLVVGAHRLEAHRQLGRETILARTIVATDLEAELMELDENLVRVELTALERAEHMLRRKELYEQLHPEVKQGGAPGKKGGGKKTKSKPASVASFAADTAAKTSRSTRSVQEDAQIARLPAAARDAIRGTPLEDQKRALLQIARVAPDKQTAVAKAVASGRCKTVREAAAKLGVKDSPPSRTLREDIPSRVREITRPLHDARERLGRLVADLDPAHASEAKAIGEGIDALGKKIDALAKAIGVPAAPALRNDGRASTGALSVRSNSSPGAMVPEVMARVRAPRPTGSGNSGDSFAALALASARVAAIGVSKRGGVSGDEREDLIQEAEEAVRTSTSTSYASRRPATGGGWLDGRRPVMLFRRCLQWRRPKRALSGLQRRRPSRRPLRLLPRARRGYRRRARPRPRSTWSSRGPSTAARPGA